MAYDFSKQRGLMGKGSGGGFCALDFSKLEEKVEFFKLEEGGQKIDIIPFPVGKKHPYVVKGKLDKGDMFYSLPIWAHRNIGAGGKTVICPNRNFGHPCPICEEAEEMKRKAKTEEEKAAVPFAALRLFYNVVDYDDPDKGIQVFETNAKYFEEPLKAAQTDADKEAEKEGEDAKFFADPENGLTVKILGTEKKFNGNKYIEPTNVSLVPRKRDVSEFVDSAIRFDTLIEEPTYDELVAIMNGADSDDDEEDDAPRAVKKAPVDEDGDRPAKKPAPKDEEDDEPAPKPKKAAEDDTPTCPVKGGVFGKDNDKHDECASCKIWRQCVKAS